MLSKLQTPDKVKYIWNNGKLVKDSSICYYDLYIWEGIRSYSNYTKDSTNVLSLREHISRLFDSAKILNISIPFTKEVIINACKELVVKNGGGDLYVRPVVCEGEHDTAVYIQVCPVFGDKRDRVAYFSNFTRGYPQYQMQVKSSISTSQIYRKERLLENEYETLVLDNQGYITGGVVTNIFISKGGYLLTPPNDGSILPGITRKNIYTIFNDVGFRKKLLQDKSAVKMPSFVLEKRLTKADIITADEVFLCGTGSEIIPIIEVQDRIIGDGKTGKFTKMMQQAYQDSVRGKINYGLDLEKA